jgi:hypothetical protein
MIRHVPILALLFALVTVLIVLVPLAYAEPPDPTWVSGYFDDGDGDDAVFVVTSSLATVDPFLLCDWSPFPVLGPRVALDTPDLASTRYSCAADARAPPSPRQSLL